MSDCQPLQVPLMRDIVQQQPAPLRAAVALNGPGEGSVHRNSARVHFSGIPSVFINSRAAAPPARFAPIVEADGP